MSELSVEYILRENRFHEFKKAFTYKRHLVLFLSKKKTAGKFKGNYFSCKKNKHVFYQNYYAYNIKHIHIFSI